MLKRKQPVTKQNRRNTSNIYFCKKDNTPFITREMWKSRKYYPTRNLSSKYDTLSNPNRIKTIFEIMKYYGFSNKNARFIVDTLGNEHATALAQFSGQRKAVALVNELGKKRLIHFIEHFGVDVTLKLLKKYDLVTVTSLSKFSVEEVDFAIRGCSIFGPKKFFKIYQELGGSFGFGIVLGIGPKYAKRLVNAIGPSVAFRALSIFKGENKVRKILRESKTNDQIRKRISQLISSRK